MQNWILNAIIGAVMFVLSLIVHFQDNTIGSLKAQLQIQQNNAAMFQNNWFSCESILNSPK